MSTTHKPNQKASQERAAARRPRQTENRPHRTPITSTPAKSAKSRAAEKAALCQRQAEARVRRAEIAELKHKRAAIAADIRKERTDHRKLIANSQRAMRLAETSAARQLAKINLRLDILAGRA